jgi:hypothetical protein
MLCQAGQDMSNAMPLSESASAATGRGRGEGEGGVANDHQGEHAELDAAGPEPVDRRAARRHPNSQQPQVSGDPRGLQTDTPLTP